MKRYFKGQAKTVEGNEGDKCKYPTRLDTYGCGCQHDCKYCYAKSLLDFRGLWKPESPAIIDGKAIINQVKKLHPGDIVRLGGMTDCFMPLEIQQRATYHLIKLLNKRNIGYLIVTKSAIVANDEYINIMRKDLAHIQITITTTDDELSKTYEKASLPSDRIKAVEKLQSLGFDVAVRLSPYIPEYVDISKINAIKCDKITVEFLRVNHWIKKWFDIDYSDYTLNHKGYSHLPLEKKKELLKPIKFKEITICEDVDEHYDYWVDNVNHNKQDCCNLRTEGKNEGKIE